MQLSEGIKITKKTNGNNSGLREQFMNKLIYTYYNYYRLTIPKSRTTPFDKIFDLSSKQFKPRNLQH